MKLDAARQLEARQKQVETGVRREDTEIQERQKY